jgi:hypothetical protein
MARFSNSLNLGKVCRSFPPRLEPRICPLVRIAIVGCVGFVILNPSPSNATWFDAATGQPVQATPLGPPGNRLENDRTLPGDPDHAHVEGHNLYWDKACNTWRDAGTNAEFHAPPLGPPGNRLENDRTFPGDPDHAHVEGHNLYWQPCPPPQTVSSTGVYVGGGLAYNTSTTTITSPTDRQKIKQDPAQAMLTARANFGPWFLTGQVTFAGTPNGSFSDVFPATPAFNTMATVNSGNVYGFNGDAGYTVWNADGWIVGIFGGYYSFNEELYGVFPGFAGTFSLLSDHWRAGEGGVAVDKAFVIGAEPFDLGVTVAGLYDNLRAGAFNGNGGGVRVNGTLSFPLGPVVGNIYAQYANLNASGSNTGVPLTFKDEVWTVGFGVTFKFGASAASPTYPVKVLPAK